MGDVIGIIVSALIVTGAFFFGCVAAGCAIMLHNTLGKKEDEDDNL